MSISQKMYYTFKIQQKYFSFSSSKLLLTPCLLWSVPNYYSNNQFQWRTELEEILEVACVDSEQWVSMLAEMMKTFPSTGSLNVTEFFHNEDNNRIFNDLITDLKKLGSHFEIHNRFSSKISRSSTRVLFIFVYYSTKEHGLHNVTFGMSLFEQKRSDQCSRSTGKSWRRNMEFFSINYSFVL